MPSVQKLPSGRFRAIAWDKHQKKQVRKSLSLKITLRREAERQAHQWQEELDQGPQPQKSPIEYATDWSTIAGKILEEIGLNATPSWYAVCEGFLDRFTDFIGTQPVTQAQCAQYIIERTRAGANPSTLRKEILFLRRVFRRMTEQGLIHVNPWQGLKIPTEPVHPVRFLTLDQFEALVQAAPPERAYRYHILAYTGARKSEARNLRWRDINFDTGQISVKNSAKGQPRYPYRIVPIAPQLLPHLQRRRDDDHLPILPGSDNNWRRDLHTDADHARIDDGYRQAMKKGIRGAGTCWRIHDFRHTLASWLVQAGVPLHRVRDILGHKSIETTQIYAHLAPDQNNDILQAFQILKTKPKATIQEIL